MDSQNYPKSNMDMPCVVFTVSRTKYAVNAKSVSSVSILRNFTKVPNAKEYIRGSIELNGEPVQLLDLRLLFGNESMRNEILAFEKIINDAKKLHTDWVDALEKSIDKGIPFTLPKDPQKCDFGIWYDNFRTDNEKIKNCVKGIEEPHRLLHLSVVEIEKAMEKKEYELAMLVLSHAKNVHSNEIIKLLNDIIIAYKESCVELVVMLKNDEGTVGIIVDAIVGVRELVKVSDSDVIDKICNPKYTNGFALSPPSKSLILLLNEGALIKTVLGEYCVS